MALAKVGLLALKTAAKPVTKWIGRRCETSERFRALCICMAEYQHTYTARLAHKVGLPSDRRSSPRNRLFRPPRQLGEEEAVKTGAAIMVELSAMGVAVACIGVDQMWNAHKKRVEKADKAEMYQRLGTLEAQHAALQSQYAQLTSQLAIDAVPNRAVPLAQSTMSCTSSEQQPSSQQQPSVLVRALSRLGGWRSN